MNRIKSILRIFATITLAILAIFIFSFAKSYKQALIAPTNLHMEAGAFDLPHGNILEINNTRGLITFDITDSQGTPLISSRHAFTDFMRWYFVSADDGSVWVHSSDIGSTLYRRSADNGFSEEQVTAELCKISPESFRKNLPETLKHDWNCGISK